ncbi:MAG: RNA methyltransferase, partial [Acidobacteria bacterium]|nr:RNA methyltransferase [Acidobacteriota bacterium]
SEKRGLSNEDLSLCHWLMRIPTCERHPSMNLGQAVAVCLYELGRDANDSMVMSPLPRATSVEVERLLNLLLQSLQVSGYARPTDISLERKVRRLLTRMNLSSLDLQLWSGMLRQILWKIKH